MLRGEVHSFRVWVESVDTLHGTALVRDLAPGVRSRCRKVDLGALDFGRVPS
jgi:hypothetical protein